MEREGVVHALRHIHRALVPGGLVVDLHSNPPAGPVRAGSTELGVLDLDEFFANVAAVEERVRDTLAEGLYVVEGETEFAMRERFESGDELLAAVSEWSGTRVPRELAACARVTGGEVHVQHNMLVRVLRRVP